MKCPNCQSELKRILYENVPVFRCFQCHGYLLAENRLDGIRRSPMTNVELLMQEVTDESQPDTKKLVRCPRCGRKMDKRFIDKPAELYIDTCRECRYVWLDGGELGRLQLTHEMTEQAQEIRRFRERHKTMTPEERAELERNIESLPDMPSELPSATSLVLAMLIGPRIRRL